MSTFREPFLQAAQASLAAMYPARVVLRGLQDFAALGDAKLRQGVYSLVADGTKGWAEFSGREGEFGTLGFAVVGMCRVKDSDTTEALEQLEGELEAELLGWCQAIKPAPLDAVYPREAAYSRGLEHPYGWIVVTMEGLYV
jgi:hypothetical protein